MSIKIKMAAWCESAGRPNNEDSFQLGSNLSKGDWAFNTDEVIDLDEKGALLVACDGMGGMNAGEVASAEAVKTIRDWFAPERLTEKVLSSPASVKKHITGAIVDADTRIKSEGKKDKEKEGMGSTVVLAWLLGKQIYVGWCGDSRAYCYNPASGLKMLSHDHSYVQELVDSGKLAKELAFDHPQNNIVTRSLGDPRQTSRPDIKTYPLCDGDIILLCSDGLSGVLRCEEIEKIMSENTESMGACREALWNESEKVGWTDNVTIALCKVLSGGETAVAIEPDDSTETPPIFPDGEKRKKKIRKIILLVLAGIVLIGALLELSYYFGTGKWGIPACCQKMEEQSVSKEDLLKSIKDKMNIWEEKEDYNIFKESVKQHFQVLDGIKEEIFNITDSIIEKKSASIYEYKSDSITGLIKEEYENWLKTKNTPPKEIKPAVPDNKNSAKQNNPQ